ncbi:MAG: DMT family transporter [Alphaproteobacteria bacterium]|nr:DMT family transporter [Alphaproteobacteria bacterium]
MLGSLLIFGTMDALIKWTSATYPTIQVVFFRSIFAFVPIAMFLARSGGLATLRTRRPLDHAGRSLVGLSSMLLFFWAFKLMPLADVIAIGFAGPIFLTALSVPLLRENVGVRRWSAVAVGFIGILIMVRPGAGVITTLALIPVLGALGYAFAMIFVRRLSRTESIGAIVFYFTVTSTTVSALGLPFGWVTPSLLDFGLLASIGLCGGFAQLMMTRAFQLAPASVIAPFEYSAMIWGVLFGWVIWHEVPSPAITVGAAIVIASGIYILHREAVLARRVGSA